MKRRIFLAIPVPPAVKKRLGPSVSDLKNKLSDWRINWVAPKNLHITLVFFGWVKAEQVKTIRAESSAAISGSLPFEVATGELSLEGRPLWLEIEQGQDEIKSLAENLSNKLTQKGSLEEERGFHSHLTLGRVKKKGKSKLPKAKAKFSWKVNRLVLYESRFVRKQRIYEEVFSFPLK